MATRAGSGAAALRSPRPAHPHGLRVEILESKLYRPTIRPGVIRRPELVARLRAAHAVPTIAVNAPAGYGKTTLLALWAEADDRPFAWLTLDPHDNDPIVLLTHLAVALDRISPLPVGTFDALRSGGVSIPATVVPRLVSAVSLMPRPVVLVLDDVHHLEDGASLDALVTLVAQVRGTAQIALAGRGMPVPLARPLSQGRAVELGVDDLAFSENGARALLRAAGLDLPDDEVIELSHRTEGWPAGLYLAALSRSGTRPAYRFAAPGGDDRLVTAYLQSELLSRLPQRDLSFLTRTSVLDHLTGPLCDAVLQESGSAAELDHLQQANLFLVPLDGQDRWYRYHALFRDLLRANLDRAGSDSSRELLRRAAQWCEHNGQPEVALRYAQEAEDVDGVARIAISLARLMYAAGRSATLMGWFTWVDDNGGVERNPAVAAIASYVSGLTGRPAAADRWAEIAERWSSGSSATEGADRPTEWLTTLRAMRCQHGPEQMRRDADEGARYVEGGRSPGDEQYLVHLLVSGVASLLLGDVDAAQTRFNDATELVLGAGRPPVTSAVLAYQALLAVRRGDWPDAAAFVDRARAVIRGGRSESHITSVMTFAFAARVALHSGDPTRARVHLAEAQRLRGLLSHAMPWYAVQILLEMAEVSLGLGDPAGARSFLRDADAVLSRRPDLGTLVQDTSELRGRTAAHQYAGSASTTLTAAELRVLPLLTTNLTLAGIADRLFLSRHTVKSHAWSTYGKLQVHTRSDAVTRARELGLLEA